MAVKLRLMRMGKKKQPTYRIVAADSRSPRDGRFIEILGTYQPRANPSIITLDADKAAKWLADGAQPTEQVAKLLKEAAAQSAAGSSVPAGAAAGRAAGGGAAGGGAAGGVSSAATGAASAATGAASAAVGS